MYSETFDFNKNLADYGSVKANGESERALYFGGWNFKKRTNTKRDVKVFKSPVPKDGAYKITITINNAKNSIKDMMVFCGRRNLVLAGINVNKGESYSADFLTYISPYYPALSNTVCTERAVYVSISGENADIDTINIEETKSPTLFIAGDSTLTDQNADTPYYPFYSCCGWAQTLALHFKNIAVCNQAHSGMTTNCFRDDGHWDIVKGLMKKGDIFIIQFGHNDQKRRNLAPFTGYINNLRWYVNEVRSLGGIPIIVSPISRIPFIDKNSFHSLLSAYALACREAAMELDVPFIDLHKLTFDFLCENFESAPDFFMPKDSTHTNEYGALTFSGFVADEIRRLKISPLCQMENTDYAPVFKVIDKEAPALDKVCGAGFDMEPQYTDIVETEQYETIKKGLLYGLLDPCVMHLHPTEVMPRAQFLMVYFKALGLNEKRPYLGEFCDLSRYEWDSGYVQACIDEKLIDMDSVKDRRFRPDDALTYGEFAGFSIRGLKIKTDECIKQARLLGIISGDCLPDAPISRFECYKGLVRVMEILDNGSARLV